MDETTIPGLQPERLDKNYKKKRVEEIGSTLAQIRARHKASRSSCPKKDDESQSSISKVSQEKLSEKNEFYMLLEEDRAKAEKLVRERPKIKEALENLKIDREQQKMVEKKLEETRAKQAAPLPEIPPEIQKRIFEMEMTIHNLRENLGEKDKVLSSKTESLKMLNEQLSHRSSEFMERAEAMRHEIGLLKEEYAKQEDLIKTELVRTKTLLDQTQSRLVEKEAECKNVSSLVEELESLKSAHSHCESDLLSAKQTLEAVNKSSLKLMAQLKSVRNERDNLKKERAGSESVESLQNRIALLEEEKGNLQLQLVDFDESKELAISSQRRVQELEEALQQNKNMLDNLQQEKNSICEQLERASVTVSNHKSLIQEMEKALQETQQCKIAAEMKAVELEEKLDSENWEENRQRADKLEKELSNLKKHLNEQENLIHSLNDRLLAKEKEMSERKTDLEGVELERIIRDAEDWRVKFVDSEASVERMSDHNRRLLEEARELKQNYENMLKASDKLNDEVKEKDSTIDFYRLKHEELTTLLETNNRNVTSLENEISKMRVTEETLRKQVRTLQESSPHPEPSDLSQKYVKVVANFKIKAKLCQELKENIAEVNKKLLEKEEIIVSINEQKLQLETKMEQLEEQIQTFEETTNKKDEQIKDLEFTIKEMRSTLDSLEMVHSDTLKNFEDSSVEVKELKDKICYLSEREHELIQQKSDCDSLKVDLSKLQIEFENLFRANEEKDKINLEVDMEREKLKSVVSSNEVEIERLKRVFESESLKTEEVCLKYREEIDHLLEQLSEVTSKLEQSQLNLRERESYTETLEQGTESMKSKIQDILFSFEENKKLMEEKSLHLCARLQEAESANDKFEKYQFEMEGKMAYLEENEKVLKDEISELKQQIEEMKQINLNLQDKNDELEQAKETLYHKVNDMETELSTLKNVKDAYNCTLDQIEILNEDLKQVRAQIESRNQELIAVDKQRRILVEKLSDMEDSYTDLHGKLKESESHFESLKTELEMKGKHLEQANHEILALQAQLSVSQTIESQTMAREIEISNIKMMYEDQIHSLQQEKEDLIGVLKSQVANEVNSVMSMAEDRLSRMAPRESSQEEGMGVFKWTEPSSSHRDVSFDEAKDEEDGWGWIAPEVKLEQEQKNADAMKVHELLQKIQDLEEEKVRILEDLKISQTKCNKLKKIAKDVKIQNEILKKSKAEKSTGLEDLDFALQEELRSQIDKTEQANKDLSAELNVLKTEKERLLKRIDVLTSANEELIEMKERQDFEVEMWKKRSNELKNQVQGLEWNLEELRASDGSPTENELEEKLSALILENEDLQRIICELKDSRLSQDKTEQTKDHSPECRNALATKDSELKKNFESVKEELDLFRQQYKVLFENNEVLNNQISEINSSRNNLQELLNSTNEELRELREKHSLLSGDLNKLEVLAKEKSDAQVKLNTVKSDNKVLSDSVHDLKLENEKLIVILEDLKTENHDLKSLLSSTKEELENSRNDPDKSHDLGLLIKELNKENSDLKKELNSLKEKSVSNRDENFIVSCSEIVGGNPPVFRGFSSLENDPFSEVIEPGSNLIAINEALKTQLKEKEGELECCKEELMAKLSSENSRLEEEFSITLEAERNAFTVYRDDFLKEYQMKEQEVLYLRTEVVRLSQELATAKDNLLNLSSNEDLTQEQKNGLASRLEESKLEVVHLKEEANQLRNELKNLNGYFETKFEEIEKSEQRLRLKYNEDLKSHEETYQQALLNKDEENAHLMCEISSKEQIYSNLWSETENLKTEVDRLAKELLETGNKLKSSDGEKQTLNSIVQSLREENSSRLDSENSESNNLVAQVDYLTQSISQKDAFNEFLTARVEQQEALICDLQQQLSDLNNGIRILETTCTNLKTVVEEKDSDVNGLKKLCGSLKDEKVSLKTENEKKQKLIEEKEKEIHLMQNVGKQSVNGSVDGVTKDKAVEVDMLVTMLAEKELEIERISKMLTDTQEKLIKAEESKLSDEVSSLQGRLDEALYTLHLSDVRCEEFTLEVMQLLEERDTLQLRLSETLRLNERLRLVDTAQTSESLQVAPVDRPDNINTDRPPSSSSLHEKIGELHSGYRKDPALQQERENRHSQQMQLYTQTNAAREDQDLNNTGDYGLFNWFFTSSSPTPASPRPTRTT